MPRAFLIGAVLALTPTLASSADAAPRNGRILFSGSTDLLSIRPDGNGRERISEDWNRDEFDSSPAGRSLVAQVYNGFQFFDASSGEQTGALNLPGTTFVGSVAWSPRGNDFAFQECERSVFTDIEECFDYAVYRVRRDGSKLRRISSGFAPSWSPEGRSLVFMHKVHASSNGNRCYGVYTMRADGSLLRRVFPRTHRCALPMSDSVRPQFAAGRIVFNRSHSLWSVLPDGRRARRLLTVPRGRVATDFEVSPDGRRIAYTTNDTTTSSHARLHVTGTRGGRGKTILRRDYVGGLAWLPR